MQDVGFGYRGGPALLSNMTLSLQPGMFHFLTGPSGAGKTTLLRMLYADLLPTSGRITAFGADIGSLGRDDIAHLRRRVGVVHQDAQFLDHLPVAENVALPLSVAGQNVEIWAQTSQPTDALTCKVESIATGRVETHPMQQDPDVPTGAMLSLAGLDPGDYRIMASGAQTSVVTDLVSVVDPDE